MSPRARRWAPMLLALLVGCGGSGVGGITIATGTNVIPYRDADRRAAPAVTGESLMEAGTVPPVRDSVAVVHFWGSWCGPCRAEQPVLEDLAKRYRGRVAFVGVNTRRDSRTAARAFWKEFGVSYPSIYDPTSRLAFRFRVRFMPVTFVLDRRGRIAAQIVGPVPEGDQLPAILDAELSAR